MGRGGPCHTQHRVPAHPSPPRVPDLSTMPALSSPLPALPGWSIAKQYYAWSGSRALEKDSSTNQVDSRCTNPADDAAPVRLACVCPLLVQVYLVLQVR